jgi:hypothetical protein
MIRRFAAVVFALALTPAALYAQDPVFTVTVASASVHKGPSVVTPVIGQVARGAALSISRNLGSWVRIAWPAAPDGIGYVHVTMGRLSGARTGPSTMPAASTFASASRTESVPVSSPTATASAPQTTAEQRVGVRGPEGITTISHLLGVGGLVQSVRSFGATGRAWHRNRVGLEVRVTRDVMTSDIAAGRMTSTAFEPRVMYALLDHVSDYVWFRPYVGSGLNVSHHVLRDSSLAGSEIGSANKVSVRVFGGSELTFAGVTRFGLSAELGYRSSSAPFAGYDAGRFSVSIAGHWYVK